MITLAAACVVVVLLSALAGLLVWQLRSAARAIAAANHRRFRGDGVYAPASPSVNDTRVTVAVLGDSTAAGGGADDLSGTPSYLIGSLVAEQIRAEVEILNPAKPWSGASQLPAQLAKLPVTSPPAAAVVLTGANDALAPRPLRTSVAALQESVAELTSQRTAVVVCTCPDLGVVTALKRPLRWVAGARSRALARRQEAAVAGDPRVATVVLHKVVSPLFRDDPGKLSPDGFHPSSKGYKDSVQPVVTELVRLLGQPWAGVFARAAESTETGPLPLG